MIKTICCFVFIFIIAINITATPYEDNLVLYLSFESEQNGTINDLSNYGNDAVNNGATLVNDGKSGNAYSFDYANSLTVADSSSLNIVTNSVTISGWFQPYLNVSDMASTYPILLMKRPWYEGGYCAHFIKSKGNIIMQYCWDNGSANTQTTTSFQQNVWYHYTGILDGNQLRVYINGNLESSVTVSAQMGSSAGYDLTIGGNFTGKIDEIAVWDRALNLTEVQNVYNNGVDEVSFLGVTGTPIPEPLSLWAILTGICLLLFNRKCLKYK